MSAEQKAGDQHHHHQEPPPPPPAEIVIAGGGIVGLSLALSLKKQLGIVAEVYEKTSTFATEAGAGLGMYPNGLRVIRDISPDLLDRVRKAGCPYRKRHWERHDGTVVVGADESLLSDGEQDLEPIGIRRSTLQKVLYQYALEQGIVTQFRKPLESATEVTDKIIEVRFGDGTKRMTHLLFGADGALGKSRSIVAGADEPALKYTGVTCLMGLSEGPCDGIYFPSSDKKDFHAVFLPTAENETCFQFHVPIKEEEANALNWGNLSDEVSREECDKMAKELRGEGWAEKFVSPLDKCIKAVRVGFALLEPRLKTWVRGRIVLVGDAGHPPVPYVGQGAQQGLEDVGVAVGLLKVFCTDEYGNFDPFSDKFEAAMKLYQEIRIKRSSEVLDISKGLGQMQADRSGDRGSLRIQGTEDAIKGEVLMYGTLPVMRTGADHDYKDDVKRATERHSLPDVTADAAMEALEYLLGDVTLEAPVAPKPAAKVEPTTWQPHIEFKPEEEKAQDGGDMYALAPERLTSLVDLVVNMLERILRQIVAHRNKVKNMAKIIEESKDQSEFDKFTKDCTVFSCFRRNSMGNPADFVEQVNLLRDVLSDDSNGEKIVADEICEIFDLPEGRPDVTLLEEDFEEIVLQDNVMTQLRSFVRGVALLYRNNPFHNFEHAVNVSMNVYKFFSRMSADKGKALTVNDQTLSAITSEPLNEFACLFSALIHDVDHEGVPNTQLAKEHPQMAAYYREKALAEQNSVDLAWAMFSDPKYRDLRACIYSNEEETRLFRQLVVNIVMATDICDKELKTFRNARWDKAKSEPQHTRENIKRKATIGIEHLIQASDVSHTMQPWHVFRHWNERLYEEMYRAYKLGRAGKDPTEFWYKGEIGFFDFYIIPLAKKLKDCEVFGSVCDELLQNAEANRKEWESQGQNVLNKMIEKMKKQYSSHDPQVAGL